MSLVLLNIAQRAARALGIPNMPEAFPFSLSPDGYTVRLPAGLVSSLAGKKKSEEGESLSLVAANQHVSISLPAYNYKATQYKFYIGVNPKLLESGQVSTPGFVGPDELSSASITLSTFKAIDLSELDWVFAITVFS